MRMSRGLASLKSNQRPPLPDPFSVIWIGSQNLVFRSVFGSVFTQTLRLPPQPSFLKAMLPFIGKKTAERIVVELKDKVGVAAAWEAASAAHAPTPQEVNVNDAVLALISLGYKQVDAHKAVKAAQEKGGAAQTSEDLVRAALKQLI